MSEVSLGELEKRDPTLVRKGMEALRQLDTSKGIVTRKCEVGLRVATILKYDLDYRPDLRNLIDAMAPSGEKEDRQQALERLILQYHPVAA